MRQSGILILLLLFQLVVYGIQPPKPLVIDSSLYAPLKIGSYMEVYHAKDITSFAHFIDSIQDMRFNFNDRNIFNLGPKNGISLFRFRLYDDGPSDQELLLKLDYSLISEVTLYRLYSGKLDTFQTAGLDHNFGTRPINHPTFIFPLKALKRQATDYLLEVRGRGEPIIIEPVITNYRLLSKYDNFMLLFYGLYYGILAIAIIINLFLFLNLRDSTYLWYVLYVFSFGMFLLAQDGLAHQYMWPNNIWLARMAPVFFGGLAPAFAIFFARKFLNLRQWTPRLDKLFVCSALAIVLICLLTVFPNPFYSLGIVALNLLALIWILVITTTAGYAVFKWKNPSAVYFMLAFLALIFGVVAYVLSVMGVMEGRVIAGYGLKFGSMLEIIILSFSLAIRFRNLKHDKEKAQEERLNQLAEMKRITEEANINLERKVAERTAELAEKNKSITDSINYAQRIQQAILPKIDEIRGAFRDSFVLFKPKDIVSGDFYWFAVKDNYKVIAAADCTGHGVPGAFMSMIGNDLLNHIVLEKSILDPDRILNELREGIVKALKQQDGGNTKDGMDMALCVYDVGEKKLRFAGANNPLYLIRNNGVVENFVGAGAYKVFNDKLLEVKGDKFPVGVGHEKIWPDFSSHEIELEEGDLVYLFSDGYADQFGGDQTTRRAGGKKFKYKRFKELLLEIRNRPMSEQAKVLEETIDEWRGELEQVDDICVIGMRV